jgi:thiol:disulfide interchange protein DsbC
MRTPPVPSIQPAARVAAFVAVALLPFGSGCTQSAAPAPQKQAPPAASAEQAAPAQQAPLAAGEVPPAAGEVAPAAVEVPPAAVEVPPAAGEVPPAAEGISPEVRAAVVSKLQGAKPSDVGPSPIPGVYEVTSNGQVAYVTADGRYLLFGNLYDLDGGKNLTADRLNLARSRMLASASESQMIVYGPQNAKHTVTVFTDIDCGYCRDFHAHIDEYNKAGIRVRYVMYPRTGPGTQSWRTAEQVWCSKDRRDALTRAKRGEALTTEACGDGPLLSQFEFGTRMGVEGTPTVYTQSGVRIGGYMKPGEMLQALAETERAASAAR